MIHNHQHQSLVSPPPPAQCNNQRTHLFPNPSSPYNLETILRATTKQSTNKRQSAQQTIIFLLARGRGRGARRGPSSRSLLVLRRGLGGLLLVGRALRESVLEVSICPLRRAHHLGSCLESSEYTIALTQVEILKHILSELHRQARKRPGWPERCRRVGGHWPL